MALAFALFAAMVLSAAPAFAADDMAGVFSEALTPALDSGGDAVVLYTVEEPTAFRFWSTVSGAVTQHACARNVALAIESGGQLRGVMWLGVCALGSEVPADLVTSAAALAHAAAKERDIAPVASGLGELVRSRRIDDNTGLTEVSVIQLRNGQPLVLRTDLIVPDGARSILVLQYEAVRLCSTGPAPLCSEPDKTLDALAQRLLRTIDHGQ